MQDIKITEIRLTSVIQKLQEVALRKVEKVKSLEDKITKLNIENAKLHSTISNMEEKLGKIPPKAEQENLILGQSKAHNIQNKQLINEKTDDNIDISINQLKGILDKN